MPSFKTLTLAGLRWLLGDPQQPNTSVIRRPELPFPAAPRPGATAVPFGIDPGSRSPVELPHGESVLIAGDPRTYVLTAVRVLALGHAQFPGTRLHVYDASIRGVLSDLSGLAHRYIDTSHGAATIQAVTDDLNQLTELIERRQRLIDDLNADLAAANDTIRRATGQVAPLLTTLRDLYAVSEQVWAAAGIDPERFDAADLHPHVVVTENAIRWALSEDDGHAFITALTRVVDRGHGLGVGVVLGVESPYLWYLPSDLIAAFRRRVAMRLEQPAHAGQVLGALARRSGIDTAPNRGQRPGYGWIAELGPGAEPTYRPVQVYAESWQAFGANCRRLTQTRRRDRWLTGDAAARSRP